MKHLLNNLSSEERNKILEQYNKSIIIETKNFKKLINVKSGNVKPLLEYDAPIRRPAYVQPMTTTTTLSVQQKQNQQLEQNRNAAKEYLKNKLVVGSTITLYDGPNNNKALGNYKILGQKDLDLIESQPTQIDLPSIEKTNQISIELLALRGSDTKHKNETMVVTFRCTKDPHTLIVGKKGKRPGFFGKTADFLQIKERRAYSKNLTTNLMVGYCKVGPGGKITLNTDF